MEQFVELFSNVANFTWQQLLMMVIGCVLIYLAIKKDMEPTLLLPMGFGAVLVNLPFVNTEAIETLFNAGIATELFPLLLFIGIGAMIDFGPLLSNPKMFLFGAAAQFGIFFTFIMARLIGFTLQDAGSIAIIGAADGPTSIYLANYFNSNYQGPIMVAAYSYMALVPIIQPPVIKLLTTKKERCIRMPYNPSAVSGTTRVLFPIFVTIIAGTIAPKSAELIGFLMFGNLIRECGVLGSLSDTAQKTLANLVTLLLGISVAFKMKAELFVTFETLAIIALGLVAFVFDTAGGVLFAKFLNLFLKNKVNPMIGAAGISAFPMASRVVHKLGQKEDNQNFLLMHAAGANVSGQVASVIAGGLMITLIESML
jgi:carboxybiotin decarboxylase